MSVCHTQSSLSTIRRPFQGARPVSPQHPVAYSQVPQRMLHSLSGFCRSPEPWVRAILPRQNRSKYRFSSPKTERGTLRGLNATNGVHTPVARGRSVTTQALFDHRPHLLLEKKVCELSCATHLEHRRYVIRVPRISFSRVPHEPLPQHHVTVFSEPGIRLQQNVSPFL